jgi:hypothetical protein
VYQILAKDLAMRLSPLFVVALLSAGCFNTSHPEYHPVTRLNYSQNVASGVAVQPAQPGQPVYVMPAPGQQQPAVMQAPPPPQPPTPPDNFPW